MELTQFAEPSNVVIGLTMALALMCWCLWDLYRRDASTYFLWVRLFAAGAIMSFLIVVDIVN